jgi:hypothetical protein
MTSRRAGIRRGLLVVIGILYVVSIPWYRTSGEAPGLWLGMPDWAAVAVVCYVAVAVLNAAAWLLTDVHDDGDEPR